LERGARYGTNTQGPATRNVNVVVAAGETTSEPFVGTVAAPGPSAAVVALAELKVSVVEVPATR
jgi:hypothetical protein